MLKYERGFTIPEVIIAGTILIILCVGTLTAFSHAAKINRGNNLRMQALAVLQMEVEHFRALKFVPGLKTSGDLNNHRPNEIRAGTRNLTARQSADGQWFNLTVTVTNAAPSDEHLTTFKTITIRATPQVTQSEGWLTSLGTEVTVQRVRSN